MAYSESENSYDRTIGTYTAIETGREVKYARARATRGVYKCTCFADATMRAFAWASSASMILRFARRCLAEYAD